MKITSPTGVRYSIEGYLIRVEAKLATREGACDCEYGHFECAAWHRGPCSNEVAGWTEDDPDRRVE